MHYVQKRIQKWRRSAFQSNCFRLTLKAYLIKKQLLSRQDQFCVWIPSEHENSLP